MNRPSANLCGESPCQSRTPERIAPCGGSRRMAWRTVGNHALKRNQTTVPAVINAQTNCTSSKRPKDAWAKAATPCGVIGCQAKGLFSACAFILDLEPQLNLEFPGSASTDCHLQVERAHPGRPTARSRRDCGIAPAVPPTPPYVRFSAYGG